MKNNKIIFLVAIVCCLAVCWLCFGAWTIADTSYQVSDFQYSYSTAYVYVVPSPNISVEEYSNIYIYCRYTLGGSLRYIYGNLSAFTNASNGLFYKSDNGFSSGTSSVSLMCSVNSNDVSIGSYYITSAYNVSTTPSLVPFNARSNLASSTFLSDNYRTVILFVDKVSVGGVSQEQYDDLLLRYEDTIDQLEQAELLNDQLYNDNLTLHEDLNALQVNYNQVSQQLAQVEQLYSNLQGQFTTLQGLYDQAVIDRDMWESYAQGIEEQLDELYFSNQQLQRDYDNLLREYNIIVSENQSIGFVERAFLAVGNILEIEILPNITIGTIVAVPLILGVVFLVLRLVRGE